MVEAAETDWTQVRVSQFNHFAQREDGSYVVFNARTGFLGTISQALHASLAGDPPLINELPATERRELVRAGLLTTRDELAEISRSYANARGGNAISLTIAPTVACNFACSYCYQDHDNAKVMSPQTQAKVLRFVEHLADTGLEQFSLTWFGGEPLIAHKVLKELTTNLRDLCRRRQVKFGEASIITNASLLTRERAEELASIRVRKAQVSFDSYVYDKGRLRGVCMADGSPSPILLNCLANRDLIDFSIRINVGKSLQPDLERVMDFLKLYGFANNVYVARIHNEKSGLAWASTPTDHTVSVIQFVKKRDEVIVKDERYLTERLRMLKPRTHYCGATRLTSLTLDALGNVYRCWHSVTNPQEAVFNLDQVNDSPGGWDAYSPLNYVECRSCKVLPLCMGGCAHGRVSGLNPNPPCEPIKFEIDGVLKLLATKVRFEVVAA